MAGWQSGYAAACKAVYVGSIPALASNKVDPRQQSLRNKCVEYILIAVGY